MAGRYTIKDVGETAFEIWLDGVPLMAFTGPPAVELRAKIHALVKQGEAQLDPEDRPKLLDLALEWLFAGAWYATAQMQRDPAVRVVSSSEPLR